MAIPAARLGLVTPLLLSRNGSGRLGPQRRRRMQGARPAKCSWASSRTAWSGAADARAPHHRLAGTDRTTIDRLAWNGRGTASWSPRPGRLRRRLAGHRTGLLLLQTCNHVRARRHHGTRGRLSCKIGARLWAQRRSGSGRGVRRGGLGRGRRTAGHRLRGKCDGRRRDRHGRRSRGHGLARSRQDLAGARCRYRARWNRSGSQRGMQRRRTATGQWRSYGRGFRAQRFFHGGCCGAMDFSRGRR